jgi:hypothetical protein
MQAHFLYVELIARRSTVRRSVRFALRRSFAPRSQALKRLAEVMREDF